jgi:hypothetical protein
MEISPPLVRFEFRQTALDNDQLLEQSRYGCLILGCVEMKKPMFPFNVERFTDTIQLLLKCAFGLLKRGGAPRHRVRLVDTLPFPSCPRA